jgi:hypothetical protein
MQGRHPPTWMLALLVPLDGGAHAFHVPSASLARFEGYAMHRELAAAHSVALVAAEALRQADGGPPLASSKIAEAFDGTPDVHWIWGVDEDAIAISILVGNEPVLALVHSLLPGSTEASETIFGVCDEGVYTFRGSEGEHRPCESGGASPRANVLDLPPKGSWCSQLDACVQHLEEVGVGMPLEIKRKAGRSSYEGLRDVVLSRADFHIAPPAAFLSGQPCPPAEVCVAKPPA